jgi:ubiquitin C-terminal hydrolase
MVDFSDDNKNSVNVEFREGQERPPTYSETQDDAVPIEDMNVSTEVPPLALEWNQEKSNPRGRSNAITDQSSKFSVRKTIEKPQKYRGLVNQAMTCYLNSLLQTLYMTPEFRNALYTYNDASEKNTIENPTPEQLLDQKN